MKKWRIFTKFLYYEPLGTTSKKKKSKKRDFVPFSFDPYPPTIKRDILIRDIFDFIFPPTLLAEIGTFLKKNWFPSTFLVNLKGTKIGIKIIRI